MIENSEQLYDPANEDRGDLARELGVDYVVVSKRFTDVGDLSNKDYEKCYGPLTLEGTEACGEYEWINHAWPWEVEA